MDAGEVGDFAGEEEAGRVDVEIIKVRVVFDGWRSALVEGYANGIIVHTASINFAETLKGERWFGSYCRDNR